MHAHTADPSTRLTPDLAHVHAAVSSGFRSVCLQVYRNGPRQAPSCTLNFMVCHPHAPSRIYIASQGGYLLSNQQLLITYMRETPSLWVTGGLALEAGAGRGMNAVGLSAAVAASAVTSSTVAVEALDLMFMRLVQMTETGDERSFEVGEGAGHTGGDEKRISDGFLRCWGPRPLDSPGRKCGCLNPKGPEGPDKKARPGNSRKQDVEADGRKPPPPVRASAPKRVLPSPP